VDLQYQGYLLLVAAALLSDLICCAAAPAEAAAWAVGHLGQIVFRGVDGQRRLRAKVARSNVKYTGRMHSQSFNIWMRHHLLAFLLNAFAQLDYLAA
jgi:hypothetical protein